MSELLERALMFLSGFSQTYDLEKMVATSDRWILERTGIRERRIASGKRPMSPWAESPSNERLKTHTIHSDEIEMLIVGTNTTEPVWPSAGGHIAHMLDLKKNIPFFDVQAGCTGFNYALSVAEQFIKSGHYRTVAVVERTNFQRLLTTRTETRVSFLETEQEPSCCSKGITKESSGLIWEVTTSDATFSCSAAPEKRK